MGQAPFPLHFVDLLPIVAYTNPKTSPSSCCEAEYATKIYLQLLTFTTDSALVCDLFFKARFLEMMLIIRFKLHSP